MQEKANTIQQQTSDTNCLVAKFGKLEMKKITWTSASDEVPTINKQYLLLLLHFKLYHVP